MKSITIALAIAAVIGPLTSCERGTAPAPASIVLTQDEASLLVSRVAAAAQLHSEIAWLADSVNLVIAAGAEADRLDVTTDLAPGPFYAVGLQRAFPNAPSPFSTFHLIAFNDPSNPTDFIIIGGYHQGAPGSAPPQSASGTFSSPNPVVTVTGHLFHFGEALLSEWRASTGSALLQTGTVGDACASLPVPSGVTCTRATLGALFNIDVAFHDAGGQNDTRMAKLTLGAEVSGIKLIFQ